MNLSELFINTAYAADEITQKGSTFGNFMPIILIVAVFYFIIIRPQQKKNKEHQNKLNSLVKGDEVITSGGIIGTIVNTPSEGDNITIEIAKDVKIQINKMYIAEFMSKTANTEKKVEKKSKKSASEHKANNE